MTSYINLNSENLTPRVAYRLIYSECRIQNAESTFYFKGETPSPAIQSAIDNANASWLSRNDSEAESMAMGAYFALPVSLLSVEKKANEPIDRLVNKHYILMCGQRGYLPDYCEVFEDIESALYDFVSLCIDDPDLNDYDIEVAKTDLAEQVETTDFGFISQSSRNIPYEYVQIDTCTCSTPHIHSDSE